MLEKALAPLNETLESWPRVYDRKAIIIIRRILALIRIARLVLKMQKRLSYWFIISRTGWMWG